MKYAIIENEEFAFINLKEVISAVRPNYECIFSAETVKDSVEYLSRPNDVGLIFMDIELDDGNCFEIFKQVDIQTPIIFTTAYDEYAIKAFKVNSVDYLLKPVAEEDVERAIHKFESMHSASMPDYSNIAAEIAKYHQRQRILIGDGSGYSFVYTDDIGWFEAEDKYITIVLTDGKRRLTDISSLANVISVLDPNRFFQLSRSVVASIDVIGKVSKYFKGRLKAELTAGTERRTEIVSAARRLEFLDWLGHTAIK